MISISYDQFSIYWYERELHAHSDGSEETVSRIDVESHHHPGSMHKYFGLFHLDYSKL